MRTRIVIIMALSMFLYSCPSDSHDDHDDGNDDGDMVCNNECNENRLRSDDVQFVLSLTLNNKFKDKVQTIFIEHPDNSPSNNIFAIGCKIVDWRFNGENFDTIVLKEFNMKPIVGNCMKITKISPIRSKPNEVLLNIDVEPSDKPIGHNNEVYLVDVDPTRDVIEVRVNTPDSNIYTRICTNYISPPRN